MGRNVEIRDLVRDDLPRLLAAYRDLLPDDEATPPRTETEPLWDEILANPSLLYLGAFVGQDLLATCTAAIIPNLTRGLRPYAVIENVWTSPSVRRQGHGTAVMREMVDRCWAAGCYKVMLLSAVHRGGAHEFYERIGFDKNAKQAFVVRRT